jgi:hypothetical protein
VLFSIQDLNATIEPWCQYSILRKTALMSLATESLPSPDGGRLPFVVPENKHQHRRTEP